MDTSALKSFAAEARTQLLSEIAARVATILKASSSERIETPALVSQLEDAIDQAGGGETGIAHVVDRAAYAWFNRIVALRFMDSHGYTGVNVVSPAEGATGFPEVLSLATAGQIDPDVVPDSDAQAVKELLNGVRQAKLGPDAHTEAYSILLKAYCSFWNEALPFMFDRRGGYLELLIPDNILAESSVIKKAAQVLTIETCEDVEVIGWLYQFYISERKDEVYAGFKKKKKAGADEIPPATQLFTPHWIVRYLAENSIGRLWLLNFPNSSLKSEMKYYIEPVDEPTDFLKISGPEDIKIIDPACGSGHMLTYAFDLLYAMYQERGYSASQIPSLILENNLFGTEIDERAGSLAAFALAMKAASKRRLFLKRPVLPNICVLKPISFTEDEIKTLLTPDGDHAAEVKFWNLFEKADLFGSLLRPDAELTERLAAHVAELSVDPDIFIAGCLDRAHRVIEQAQYLARQYEIVIANPPYLGSGNMGTELSAFMKKEYALAKQDLYGAFMVRGTELADEGFVALILGDTWMALSKFESLRELVLTKHSFDTFLHLRDSSNHPDVFGANTAFVLDSSTSSSGKIPFIHLSAFGAEAKRLDLQRALASRDRDNGFYEVNVKLFEVVPGTPFTAYRLSEKMLDCFSHGKPMGELVEARNGFTTGDNDRFLRFWWEISLQAASLPEGIDKNDSSSVYPPSSVGEDSKNRKWVPYNKGGAFRKWYGNHEYVINWENDGEELRSFERAVLRNLKNQFSPSVSWSDISSGEAAFRRFPPGFIHDVTGHSAFGNEILMRKLLLLMNSAVARELLKVLAPTMHFHIGYVGSIPVFENLNSLDESLSDELTTHARLDWDAQEASWCFGENPLIRIAGSGCIAEAAATSGFSEKFHDPSNESQSSFEF